MAKRNHGPSIRAFIACELPDHVIDEVAAMQTRMKRIGLGVKWVNPEHMHITLAFLGNVAPDILPAVAGVIGEVTPAILPLPLQVKGAGVFPNPGRPAVIWMGLDGAVDALAHLQQQMTTQLIPLGFKPEHRRFKGHITLARVKKKVALKKIQQVVDMGETFTSARFILDHLTLFESRLTSTGPVYTRRFTG